MFPFGAGCESQVTKTIMHVPLVHVQRLSMLGFASINRHKTPLNC